MEFSGPVPVGDVEVSTTVVRAARSAVLVEAKLSAGGRQCLAARVWLTARADPPPSVLPVDPQQLPPPGAGWDAFSFPYADALDWRVARGSLQAAGPIAVWVRQRIPLLAGHVPSGLQRAVLIADSGNGVSALLDWASWSFMNVDLDVHLARPLRGEWVCLDAATQLGASGSGLARSTLSDLDGLCGAGLQTLIVRPATRPQSPRS